MLKKIITNNLALEINSKLYEENIISLLGGRVAEELVLNIPLRATYYARVSTEHLEQIKSLQNQNEHFSEYIMNNPNWTYIPGYVDEGISGVSDIKRKMFI